jgi:hypothetical protein
MSFYENHGDYGGNFCLYRNDDEAIGMALGVEIQEVDLTLVLKLATCLTRLGKWSKTPKR